MTTTRRSPQRLLKHAPAGGRKCTSDGRRRTIFCVLLPVIATMGGILFLLSPSAGAWQLWQEPEHSLPELPAQAVTNETEATRHGLAATLQSALAPPSPPPAPSPSPAIDPCVLHHSTCSEVKANCPLGAGDTFLINYYWVQYCLFAGAPAVSYIVLFLWLILVISLLATTADNFFVVQLQTLSDVLHISPSTAGITLLALGNSSPDTFTDIAAVQSGSFALALNELLGAAMFLTTIVFAAVILVSTNRKAGSKDPAAGDSEEGLTGGGGEPWCPCCQSPCQMPGGSRCEDVAMVCQVERKVFLRDVTVFFASLVMLLTFTATGSKFSLYESLTLISLYVLYVAGVIWYTAEGRPDAATNLHSGEDMWKEAAEPHECLHDGHLHRLPAACSGQHPEDDLREPLIEDGTGPATDDDCLVGLDWQAEVSLVDRIFFVAEWPFSLLRWLSIPNGDFQWCWRRRLLASVTPLGAVCVVILDFSGNWTGGTPFDGFTYPLGGTRSGSGCPMVVPLVAIAVSLGVAVRLASDDRTLPRWHMGLVALAFVSTVAWLDLIGNEFVALLTALGHMTKITATQQGTDLLGVTVLAWANSVGDFVADTAVAKAGSPRMGISSVFGSPLLTACLGMGLATLVASASAPGLAIKTNVSGTLKDIFISFVFLGGSLLMSLIVIVYNKFIVPRRYAFALIGLYALFITFQCLETVGTISF